MGTTSSKGYEDKEEAYLQKLETEAVRTAIPRGLVDEKANDLKMQLHYCLTRNDWWFTMGGLVIGGFLSWRWRAVQPIAAAAILAPGLDWMYSQSVCTEELEAYAEHKKRLMGEYRATQEEVKRKVRQDYAARSGRSGGSSGSWGDSE
ncbi:hypothetical protein FOA52_004984 [Chlamydomonas sp. UWO 241]|nr:hypothetical protein FOA52_004984 [Chlamydomonas sp. UWO 241]